ncbi:hypothetical protein [Sphingomonas bacterium]|uniref:hypothetical protein n=1 Tax=Sphingomonas bacterium TaxID=1895847 RepID=UPI001575952E|nr:hypothetical protein [Sphingomonas bacterium]
MTDIDDRALDSLSVAPADDDTVGSGHDSRQGAGQDKSIAERLERNPASVDAKLDNGLDESMDASDPPSVTQPSGTTDAPPSSGYDQEAEKALRDQG